MFLGSWFFMIFFFVFMNGFVYFYFMLGVGNFFILFVSIVFFWERGVGFFIEGYYKGELVVFFIKFLEESFGEVRVC